MKRKSKRYEIPKAKTLVLKQVKNPSSFEEIVRSLESKVPDAEVRETVWDLMDQGEIRLTWDRKFVAK